LTGIGLPALADHADVLARELVAATAPHGWTPYRELDAPGASSHIVSLRHPTLAAPAVQARLAEAHRIVAGSRGGGVRVSLHAYNDSSDIDALADALGEVGSA
jgi:cysteine desulfurase / selenocysteine lyase